MYVSRDKYGKAIVSTAVPDSGYYWEVSEFPSGEGALMITEDGELYRTDFGIHNSSQSNDDSTATLISALID